MQVSTWQEKEDAFTERKKNLGATISRVHGFSLAGVLARKEEEPFLVGFCFCPLGMGALLVSELYLIEFSVYYFFSHF